MIDITKKYKTRSGYEVRIYATDGSCNYPIHGSVFLDKEWIIIKWTIDGEYSIVHRNHSMDLIEVSPYEDFKIDDKVLVWEEGGSDKYKRYFAGITTNGKPLVFVEGSTSWSSNGRTVSYDHCEKVCDE